MKTKLACVLGLLLTAGCAHTPAPDCQSGAARQKGYFQALEGKLADESLANSCPDKEDFLDNYRVGYQEGLRKHCDASNVEKEALTDGNAGHPTKFVWEKYQVCENRERLKVSYDSYYQQGLQTFCGYTRMQSLGEGRGLSGLAADYPGDSLGVCGVDRAVELKDAYHRGYHDGLEKFCSAPQLANEAYHEGSKGMAKIDVNKKYGLCSNEQRRNIEVTYEAYYTQGLTQWCSPESIAQEAKRRAQAGASPDFPHELQTCLHKFPDSKIQYPSIFTAERKKFVESHCTYQAGLADGLAEAQKTNLKKRKSPAACDTSEDDPYYEGYSLGWRQEKDRLCDVGVAYERGAEDARSKKKQEYTMPQLCPRDYQEKLYSSYLQGYTFIQNQSTR